MICTHSLALAELSGHYCTCSLKRAAPKGFPYSVLMRRRHTQILERFQKSQPQISGHCVTLDAGFADGLCRQGVAALQAAWQGR